MHAARDNFAGGGAPYVIVASHGSQHSGEGTCSKAILSAKVSAYGCPRSEWHIGPVIMIDPQILTLAQGSLREGTTGHHADTCVRTLLLLQRLLQWDLLHTPASRLFSRQVQIERPVPSCYLQHVSPDVGGYSLKANGPAHTPVKIRAVDD